MPRVPSLSSPFLLGFDEIERALDRIEKATGERPDIDNVDLADEPTLEMLRRADARRPGDS